MRAGAVQIAGVHDPEEARLLVECGVDFIGLPLRLDLHAQDCSEPQAARIVASLPDRVQAVLITYATEPREIAALAEAIGVAWVQLHADVSPAAVAELRERAPALRVAKSLVVRGGDLASQRRALARFAPHVDAFLTDSFDPATGASGATGRVHDWEISRALALHCPRPLVLAGGLTPANVASAIRAVRPAAVDAHTGVEGEDGRKCPRRVAGFVAAARAEFAKVAGAV